MKRSDIYEFLDEHDFVKTGSFGTSTGFGFTETYTFFFFFISIDVCECDEEKTVIRVERKGVPGMLLSNTNLNSVTPDYLEELIGN